ncbi:MAG TPA: response regulator [Chloroflexota bacterium]|nr:response regulator [Chloroflexota bacterium]
MTEISGETVRVLLLSRDELAESTYGASDGALAEHQIVEQVSDLEDCLSHYRPGDYDAILLDSAFGDLSATEAVTRIRSTWADVPIVVLADPSDRDPMSLVRLGAQDVLPRSQLTPEQLARSLRYAVELKRSAVEESRLADFARIERDKAERAQREVSALLNAVQRINNVADPTVTIDGILDTALDLTNGDTAGIGLIGPSGGVVRYENVRGLYADRLLGLTFRIEEDVTGAVVRSSAAIVVDDAATDPSWQNSPVVKLGGFRSGLFVPLRSAAERIGVLVVWSRNPSLFTRTDEAQLWRLSEYAALAIEHARRRTEFEVAQAALKRSEQEFHFVIENASDVIVVLESDATIRYASPAFERILGYEPLELRDRSLFDYVVAEDRGMAMTAFRTAASNPSIAEFVDLRALHRDGTPRMFSAAITNLVDQPAVAGVVVNMRDVTERHRLADQLRQGQKLEAIGRLAGGVAHDFNNLLTVINGFSDLILSDLEASDAKRRYVERILDAGNSTATLTRQLLAFSRQQVLSPQVLDLNQIFGATEPMLRRLIGENIVLTAALADDLGEVVADPSQIEQAIVNLAIHARGRMPGGGRLTVQTRNVSSRDPVLLERAAARSIQQVLLSISDTGPVIDDTSQAQIFEPFRLSDGSSSESGLGLAAVYGIVKQSDGDIFVSSSEGGTTSFVILLPRVDTPVRSEVETPTNGHLTAPTETVLLVEDEERVRAFVRVVLDSAGYRVLEADSAEAGLAVSRKYDGPIDALVTDLVMPGLGGRRFAEQLLCERPELKVVYMSGYTDDEVIRYGVLGPGALFIAKPFGATTLVLTVRQVLDAT